MEPLLEIDGDVRSFEVFLSSRTPVLTARDIKTFLPCTVNLDPKLREIIAGEPPLYRALQALCDGPWEAGVGPLGAAFTTTYSKSSRIQHSSNWHNVNYISIKMKKITSNNTSLLKTSTKNNKVNHYTIQMSVPAHAYGVAHFRGLRLFGHDLPCSLLCCITYLTSIE